MEKANIFPLQYHFGAASMNDTEYCHLWVDGARNLFLL